MMGRHAATATATKETLPSWWRVTRDEMDVITDVIARGQYTGQVTVQYDVTGWFWLHSSDPVFASIMNTVL